MQDYSRLNLIITKCKNIFTPLGWAIIFVTLMFLLGFVYGMDSSG